MALADEDGCVVPPSLTLKFLVGVEAAEGPDALPPLLEDGS